MLYNLINDKQFMLKIKKILISYGIPLSNISALALIILLTSGVKNFDNSSVKRIEKIFTHKDIDFSQSILDGLVSRLESEKIILADDVIVFDDTSETINQEISTDEKIKIILERYNLTKEQFDVIAAIVLAESKANSYDDAYCVINTIFNRINSKSWTSWVSSIYGDEVGNNLYYQATCPNQFVVYDEGIYLDYVNRTDLPGYQAVIDLLYSEETRHNYLSFVANGNSKKDKVQFVENGNLYYNELSEDDVIEKQTVKIM